MLAGKMRLRTFGLIVSLTSIFAGFALWTLWPEWSPKPEPVAKRLPLEAAGVKVQPPDRPVPTAADTRPPVEPRSAAEAFLIGRSGHDLGKPKAKDAWPGPVKVNLYQDDGHSTINRAKVDLDRDDKWDEKWTFEDGRISKKVAPEDDEQYTQVLVLIDNNWVAQ